MLYILDPENYLNKAVTIECKFSKQTKAGDISWRYVAKNGSEIYFVKLFEPPENSDSLNFSFSEDDSRHNIARAVVTIKDRSLVSKYTIGDGSCSNTTVLRMGTEREIEGSVLLNVEDTRRNKTFSFSFFALSNKGIQH
jgi:hypothetical protein